MKGSGIVVLMSEFFFLLFQQKSIYNNHKN